MATATTSYSNQVWGWHEKYLYNAEPKSFDMAAPTVMKSTSTAGVITSASMVIYTHTDANNGIALTCTVKTKDGTKTLINQKLKINKADNDEKYTFSASGLNISGDSVFGSNASGYTVTLTFSNDYNAATTRSFSVNTGKNSMQLTLTYTPKCRISFSGTNVTATSATTYTEGDTVTIPTVGSGVTERIGYTLSGWTATEWDETGTPPSTVTPAAGHVDQTYYAYWTKTPYHVNVQTVNQSGDTITAPTGQTGNTRYVIDGERIILTAPTTDHVVSSTETYVFTSWSLHRANGETIGSSVNSTWDIGKLDSTAIGAWFAGGANTITAKAHYQRVYDVSFSLCGVNPTIDPTAAGHSGLASLVVYNGWGGSPTLLASFGHNDLFGDKQWVNIASSQIRVDVELTNTSEYALSVDDTTLTNMTEDTGKRTVSNGITSLYYTLQTSTANMNVCLLKQFFSLTLTNNTDNAVKVYRDGIQISPASLSHIARGTPAVIIDARESATSDTQYNATLMSDTGVVITDNDHLGTIASMVKDHRVSVTTTQANCTVTTIMNGVSSSETVARTSSYSFNLTATAGSAMSGVLTMGESQIQSWSGVTGIQYTIAHVTDNVTLTVTEVSSPKDWVRVDISDCPHGSIGVQDNTLVILKSSFTGFRITGISVDTNYEIVEATYEWLVGGTSVGGGTISTVPATITYSGTMPADSEVVCVVHVNFRHNVLYLTRHESGSFVLRRPSSLWLNANGACTEIIGVVVQTQSHPAPEVLYGNLTLPSS